jgi:predicted nucleotidyltransferase
MQLEHLNTVLLLKFGSYVYGTNLPTSDLDIKGIYLPNAQDILLQRVSATLNFSTKRDPSQRNTSEDIDTEIFSLQQYLHLLLEGQTVALDILFTPKEFYLNQPHPVWQVIQDNKSRFIHAGVTAFAGYCRQQAAKYGIKGSRLAALRETLELLSSLDSSTRLKDHEDLLLKFVENSKTRSKTHDRELIQLVQTFEKNRQIHETHLQVCNRKVPLHATVKYAKQVLQKIFDQYGLRARLAEKNEGVDWKALMHAVRVLKQANELLETGQITFPRPERDLLLQIRQGSLSYAAVANLIEDGLIELEESSKKSPLPREPDRAYADNLVAETYRNQVCHSASKDGLK